MIGTILRHRYRLDRLLGEGGMGAVYAAVDLESGGAVAVKVLGAETAASATQVSRFHQEARAAAAIASPHIARTLDAGTDARGPFLVMELLEGEDAGALFHRLIHTPPELALRIAAQACRGLAKAHEARVVHRDIKPANLFLAKGEGDKRTLKILDFGIAKLMPAWGAVSPEVLTRTGAVLGSPLYMAPEQARGARRIDHRADLWSVGIVLYQALAARAPNQEIEQIGELIVTICTEAPRPIQSAAPWVSPAVAAIVDRALRLDPAERFQSAREMRKAIEALLPGGSEIDEAMLVTFSKEERGRAALEIEEPPPTVRIAITPAREG